MWIRTTSILLSSALLWLVVFLCMEGVSAMDSCYGYRYTIFVTSDLQNGMNQVDNAVEPFLQTALYTASVDATILNITSKLTSTGSSCPGGGQLNHCSLVSSQICARVSASLDRTLVGNFIFEKTQQFLTAFNDNHTNSIQAIFEYPITVRTSLVVSLLGTTDALGTNEKTILEQEMRNGLSKIFQSSVNGYELKNVKIVLQGAVFDLQRNGQFWSIDGGRRFLQSQQNVPDNRVELSVVAQCAGSQTCTSSNFSSTLQKQATPYIERNMLRNLQQDKSTAYFQQVQSVQAYGTSTTFLNFNVTALVDSATRNIPPAPTTKQPIHDEQAPWWTWLLLGASLGIIALGSMWTGLTVYKLGKEERIRNGTMTAAKQPQIEKYSRLDFPQDNGTQHDSSEETEQEQPTTIFLSPMSVDGEALSAPYSSDKSSHKSDDKSGERPNPWNDFSFPPAPSSVRSTRHPSGENVVPMTHATSNAMTDVTSLPLTHIVSIPFTEASSIPFTDAPSLAFTDIPNFAYDTPNVAFAGIASVPFTHTSSAVQLSRINSEGTYEGQPSLLDSLDCSGSQHFLQSAANRLKPCTLTVLSDDDDCYPI